MKYASLIAASAVSLLAIIIYSGTINYPFMFDDGMYIVNNPDIRDLSNFWPPFGTRYLTLLSFALNFKLGGLNTFGYHAVNIAVHAANAVLVFNLVRLIFRTPLMAGSESIAFNAGLAASVLFAVHPVETQAVTYITQRFASLTALFYLVSVTAFLKWRFSSREGLRAKAFYAAALISAVLAQFTKETGFTLPFMIILLEFAFFEGGPRRFIPVIPFLLVLLIVPIMILAPGPGAAGFVSDWNRAGQIQDLKGLSSYIYFLTEQRVILTYLRLLILPVNQNLDYDYPIAGSVTEPGVLIPLVFNTALFLSAVFFLARSKRKGNGPGVAASFGMLWFFITLSIESSFIPIYDVIFEHRVYLPSVGAFIAFSALLFSLTRYLREKAGVKASAGALTVIFLVITGLPLSAAAYKRNLVWQDEVSMWSDVAGKSPGKARAHNNLGHAYFTAGRVDEAIGEFGAALKISPLNAEAHYNLGNAYYKKRMLTEAVSEYRKAISIKENYAEAHYNLGNAYKNLGMMDEAISEFKAAVEAEPGKLNARSNLGLAYLSTGRVGEAIVQFKTVIELQPQSPWAHNNLGLAYSDLGRVEEAEYEFRTALEIKPDFEDARNNLNYLLNKQGRD